MDGFGDMIVVLGEEQLVLVLALIRLLSVIFILINFYL
jgi:hypothetical protein